MYKIGYYIYIHIYWWHYLILALLLSFKISEVRKSRDRCKGDDTPITKIPELCTCLIFSVFVFYGGIHSEIVGFMAFCLDTEGCFAT